MPTPTDHTPSGADLGGPVIILVMLVIVPLSNNGAKTAAKPSGTCPIVLPSVSSYASLLTNTCSLVPRLENLGTSPGRPNEAMRMM